MSQKKSNSANNENIQSMRYIVRDAENRNQERTPVLSEGLYALLSLLFRTMGCFTVE
jgi:hypothetical protein